MKSDLDVGILVDVLYTGVKALKVASNAALGSLVESVLFVSWVGLLELVDEVLKHESDHGDNSNNERSESERSKMISATPFHGHPD